jgi:hypothetical protein
MNNGKHQEKAQRESIDEFCKRLGIKLVRGEKGACNSVPAVGRDRRPAIRVLNPAMGDRNRWNPTVLHRPPSASEATLFIGEDQTSNII